LNDTANSRFSIVYEKYSTNNKSEDEFLSKQVPWNTKFDGWPDVIMCGPHIHYFNKIDDELIMYSSPRQDTASNIIFTLDGEYESMGSDTGYSIDCKDKSIDL